MALFQRKLLPELTVDSDKKPDTDKKDKSCYDCYLCPDECNIYATPPPPPPSPKHQMSIFLILVICFLGAGFIFFSYIIIRRYRLSLRNPRRRDSSPMENNDFREDFIDENQGPVVDHHIWYIRTIGLPQSVIDSIPVFNYRREEKLIDGSDCSVCLNEFEENESLRLLPKCSHAFHVSCIDTWLRSHKNCPVCRSPILINNTNTSLVNAMEISSSNSGSREENELENRLEFETDEITEMRDVTENAVGLHIEDDKMAELFSKNCSTNSGRNGRFRVLSDLADHRVEVDQELEPVRRSVSMDYSSASMIYNAVAEIHAKKDEGCSDTKLSRIEKQNLALTSKMGNKNSSISRLIKSSSYRILLQNGPISMQRSFSFSGKYSLRNQ